MSGLDMDSEWTALLAGFIVSGIGVGLLNPVIADVALSVVPKEQSGMAAGINDTFRQVGIAVGIAAWGAIFLGAGAAKTQEVAGGAVDGDAGPRPGRGDLLGALGQAVAGSRKAQDTVRTAAEQGFLHGLNEILLLGAILSLSARCSPSGWSASGRSSARPSPRPPPKPPSRHTLRPRRPELRRSRRRRRSPAGGAVVRRPR